MVIVVVLLTPQGDWIDNERSGEGEFRYNTGEVYNGRWRVDKQSETCNEPYYYYSYFVDCYSGISIIVSTI